MNDRAAPLRALLRAFAPADPLEAQHHADMLALLEQPGDPFSRAHFTPGHFTASAFVLDPSGQALLLIHHRKLGRWLQPGGHLDPEDPTPLHGARRELAEEVGLREVAVVGTGLFDVDVHTIPARKGEPEHRHYDLRFLFRAPSLALRPQEEEVLGARWVPLAEVSAAQSDESVLRAVRRLPSN